MNSSNTYYHFAVLGKIISVAIQADYQKSPFPRIRMAEGTAEADYSIKVEIRRDKFSPPDGLTWLPLATGEIAYTDRNIIYKHYGTFTEVAEVENGASVKVYCKTDNITLPESLMDLALMTILRKEGYIPLHASGGMGKSNILFAGKSGCGKSTLAYRLAEIGGAFLSDDHVYLKRNDKQVTAHSFLHTALLREKPGDFNNDKHSYDIKKNLPAPSVENFCPETLVFPQFAACATPLLDKISSSDAIMRLMPLSMPPKTTDDLHILAFLSRQCQSYILSLPESMEKPEETKQIIKIL